MRGREPGWSASESDQRVTPTANALPLIHGGDLVIAPAEELDQADAVAERVGKERELAPFVRGGRAFDARAGGLGACHRGVDVGDDEIEMHRRPVAAVTAPVGRGRGGGAAGRLGEEVDRRGGAEKLDRPLAEAAANGQTEGLRVERRGGPDLGNVDIDQKGRP